MIQANELRIGNLVEYKITDEFDDRKEWWEVSEIDADDIHWLSKVDAKDEDFRPIPLTEELLLKCGFSDIDDYYDIGKSMFFYDIHKSLENSEFYIYFNSEDKNIYITFMENEESVSKKINNINSLHQLQNLYFALTNKELIITL